MRPVEELVQALVGEGALPAGSEVKKWSSDEADPPALKLDLNAAFADGILNQGTAGETLILASGWSIRSGLIMSLPS